MGTHVLWILLENKTITLAHGWLFDLSIPKVRHDKTIIIIKAVGNSLEL